MNLNFLIKKRHIFKRRMFSKYKFLSPQSNRLGLYFKYQRRFELINLKIFKKLLRKKYFKKGLDFKQVQYWLLIKPNFLLTMKSKNARMGVGPGKYIRVASIVKADKPVFFFRGYSYKVIVKVIKYAKMKMNLDLYLQKKIKKIVNFV